MRPPRRRRSSRGSPELLLRGSSADEGLAEFEHIPVKYVDMDAVREIERTITDPKERARAIEALPPLSESGGIVSSKTVAEEAAAQDEFAARLAAATPPAEAKPSVLERQTDEQLVQAQNRFSAKAAPIGRRLDEIEATMSRLELAEKDIPDRLYNEQQKLRKQMSDIDKRMEAIDAEATRRFRAKQEAPAVEHRSPQPSRRQGLAQHEQRSCVPVRVATSPSGPQPQARRTRLRFTGLELTSSWRRTSGTG